MKERMNYAEFLDEVFKELTENKDWNLQEVTMKMFMDGCKGKEQADKLFIQRINYKHYGVKSDVLRGDWLAVYKNGSNDEIAYEFPMTLLYALYRYTGGMGLIWYEFKNTMKGLQGAETYSMLKGLWEYERLKEHLVMKIFPYKEGDFCDCVGFQHGDIAVLLCDVSEKDKDAKLVRQSQLSYWRKEEFEVVKDVFEHMTENNVANIYVGLDEKVDSSGKKRLHRTIDIETPLFLSNDEGTYGAIALYYKDSQITISHLFTEGDFWVIMPTTKEAIIFPTSCVTEEQVREKLQEILQKTPEDKVLSRQIRYYDSQKDSLEIL